jgi:hypothetical protein
MGFETDGKVRSMGQQNPSSGRPFLGILPRTPQKQDKPT